MRCLPIIALGGLLLLPAAAAADELTLTAPGTDADGNSRLVLPDVPADGGFVLPDKGQDGSDSSETGLVLPAAPTPPAKPQAPKAPMAVTAPQQQADGSTLISPLWLVAEMLRDADVAKKRYEGKVLQFAGTLDRKTDYGGERLHLYFSIDVPGYGERDIDCRVDDAVSRETAAHLGKGTTVDVVGVYEKDVYKGETHDTVQDQLHILAHSAQMDEYSNTGSSGLSSAMDSAMETLRFDECLVLTGHPDPEDARALLVAAAKAARE